ARVGLDLADAVADDAVRVVVEVRAGRRDAVDEAALDERDDARLVKAGGRHGAREREERAAILGRAAAHEIERLAFLPAHVRREHGVDDVDRALFARDRRRMNVAGALELLANGSFAVVLAHWSLAYTQWRHGGRDV